MSEVRPWIGAYVSVATFRVIKDLTVVDCGNDSQMPTIYPIGSTGPDKDERERDVWWSVNQAFMEPVTRTDDMPDYAATQIVAEHFRAAGFNGIKYGSKLGGGKSIALFDVTAAEVERCDLYRLDALSPTFSKEMYSYSVKK